MGDPKKDFLEIYEELLKQKFKVMTLASGHYQVGAPGSGRGDPLVHISQSPDRNTLKAIIARLRRLGFVWPVVETPRREMNGDGATHVEETLTDAEELEYELSAPPTIVDAAPIAALDVDVLWKRLRDAKSTVEVAGELHRDAEAKATAARKAADEARIELDRAVEAMRLAKTTFDEAFEAER